MSDGAEGASNKGVPEMCDYSLQSVRSRPAKVGTSSPHVISVPAHVGSPRQKTMQWRFAFFREPSLRFRAR